MAKYLNKDRFLQSMGLVGDETKYGNRDAEHSSRSYSTWMGYEIMDSVDDSIVDEDIVEVPCRCKDCRKCSIYDDVITRVKQYVCRAQNGHREVDADAFCSYGERREGE